MTDVADRAWSSIKNYGEIHAVFEEIDGEVEMRKGATSVSKDRGGNIETFSVEEDTTHHFKADSLISFYTPKSVFNE